MCFDAAQLSRGPSVPELDKAHRVSGYNGAISTRNHKKLGRVLTG